MLEEEGMFRRSIRRGRRETERRGGEGRRLTGGLRGGEDEVVLPGVRHLVHVDRVLSSRQELVDVD